MYDPVTALLGLFFPEQVIRTRNRILDSLWGFVLPIAAVLLTLLILALMFGWFK